MLKMCLCYDNIFFENIVDNIGIRCSTCSKATGLYVKNKDKHYKDMLTKLLLNSLLNHVGLSCMFETTQ